MIRKTFKTILCFFVFLISFIESKDAIDSKVIDNENNNKVSIYYERKDSNDTISDDEYIGILNINDINLNRGFYKVNSINNDLSKNILHLKESIPPNEKNSMVILAAHRGNSKVSFFNNLDKLKMGSIINLSYNKKDYTYILEYKYDEPKDGRLKIYRDNSKDSLILITCNKFKKNYQTIYVAYRRDDVI